MPGMLCDVPDAAVSPVVGTRVLLSDQPNDTDAGTVWLPSAATLLSFTLTEIPPAPCAHVEPADGLAPAVSR